MGVSQHCYAGGFINYLGVLQSPYREGVYKPLGALQIQRGFVKSLGALYTHLSFFSLQIQGGALTYAKPLGALYTYTYKHLFSYRYGGSSKIPLTGESLSPYKEGLYNVPIQRVSVKTLEVLNIQRS